MKLHELLNKFKQSEAGANMDCPYYILYGQDGYNIGCFTPLRYDGEERLKTIKRLYRDVEVQSFYFMPAMQGNLEKAWDKAQYHICCNINLKSSKHKIEGTPKPPKPYSYADIFR